MTLLAAKPGNQQIEVSIFSRGYGESICVHVGEGKWLIIDSLLTADGQPAALDYLVSLGCEPASDVIAFLITHWHDDHIGGAASIVQHCPSAVIALSGVLLEDEFTTVLARANPGSTSFVSSGIDELAAVLPLIKQRARMFCWHNQMIAEQRVGHCFRFEALSPSSADFLAFVDSTSGYIPSAGPGTRIPSPPRNEASVAAVVEIEQEMLLFGGDLETSSSETGWHAIFRHSWRDRGKACFFKIPHHGSLNGHHEETWRHLLVVDVTSGLTPWSRGRKLPLGRDIDRILKYTPNAHIASHVRSAKKKKKRDRVVERTLEKFGIQVLTRQEDLGHLRFRKLPGEAWTVEYGGDSDKLSRSVLPSA